MTADSSLRHGSSDRRLLLSIYRALRAAAGHRSWWPGRSRLEIILGAILTQNTSWNNAARALATLRHTGLLRLDRLRAASERQLAEGVRSSGTYRLKARKIRAFLDLLEKERIDSIAALGRIETEPLRRLLLSTWGLGPETVDSILLYAFERPVFVVDAYTKRVLSRHGLISTGASYDEIQRHLMDRLPERVPLFNDFHAQIVWVGQRYCRRVAHCCGCPLQPFLEKHDDPDSPTFS